MSEMSEGVAVEEEESHLDRTVARKMMSEEVIVEEEKNK